MERVLPFADHVLAVSGSVVSAAKRRGALRTTSCNDNVSCAVTKTDPSKTMSNSERDILNVINQVGHPGY